MAAQEKSLYTLIPLDEFKSILGIDDRDDKIARFCLVTSTLTIEQYCKRRLLRKNHYERMEFTGDLLLPFREYPVSKVLAVYVFANEQLAMSAENQRPVDFQLGSFFCEKTPAKALVTPPSMAGIMLEPEFYGVTPDCGCTEDIPFNLSLSPALKRYRNLTAINAVYWAGYANGKIPADLAAACLELASWNFNRYKGRRVGMVGNIRGAGQDKEHFETVMPENVRHLLEPYRRKTI